MGTVYSVSNADVVFVETTEERPMAMELRPEVRAFAEAMETKLRKHDGEWGRSWKEGNQGVMLTNLIGECHRHVGKLVSVVDLDFGTDDLTRKVLYAAADVGNFAMMIADVMGALDTAPHTDDGGHDEYAHG